MNSEKIEKFLPETVLSNLFNYLFPDKYRKELKITVITSVVTAFLCYFMFMVNGYAGPDSMGEGVYMYSGFGWAVSLGRWFIAYAQRHVAVNAVIPFTIIMVYTVMCAFAAIIIFRMFDITNKIWYVLVPASFVSFPIVTIQFGYLYMAAFYAVSFFCAVAGTKLIRMRKVWSYPLGLILYICMLGSYQSYVGGVAALALMLLIIDCIGQRKVGQALIDFGAVAGIGGLAAVADLFVMNATISINHIDASDRVNSFSFSDIIENFDFSFKYSRVWFFSYFKDTLFSRDKLYIIVFALIIISEIILVIRLLINKKIVQALLVIVATCLIPYAMNISQFLFPHNGIDNVMRYHYVLILPLLAALLSNLKLSVHKCLLQWTACLSVVVLVFTFITSASIGGLVYKILYTETYTEAMTMVGRVYALEGYEKDVTKVMLADSIEWGTSANEFGLLLSETNIGAGPVFWGGFVGLDFCRKGYFLNYLGVNVGDLSIDEYYGVVESDEYKEMPVWPAEGSVKMINGIAVIKNAGE